MSINFYHMIETFKLFDDQTILITDKDNNLLYDQNKDLYYDSDPLLETEEKNCTVVMKNEEVPVTITIKRKSKFIKALHLILNECYQNDVVIIKSENGEILFSNHTTNTLSAFDTDNYLSGQEVEIEGQFYTFEKREATILNHSITIELFRDYTKEKELIKQNYEDSLTGLFNKEGLHNELQHLILEFKEKKLPFVVVFSDLDFFKLVNDSVGHIIADRILGSLGFIIKKHIREQDIAGRFGGEEFTIIFPNCTLTAAYKRIEALRKKIEKELSTRNVPISMSFGMDIYDGTKAIEQVLSNADTALYHSKNNGRNQTTIYDAETMERNKKRK